ncbi:MAG: hypothetical protein P1U44_03365 [Vicingaceae bacterium]|nr:hypothetical protein [Flavobacteriales bacterium]MDF1674732.1 hypothetical protein [Vicingaceae bacterium]
MIVPNEITPIDYDKLTNEFIFVLEDFILRVNYENNLFMLETPNQLAYNEDFDFIKSPPEWFEVITFGLVDWIRKAINWNTTKSQPKDQSNPFSFTVEGIIYTGAFNPKTNDLSLNIPSRTIICNRDAITISFPELQYTEHGKLITIISSIIVGNMLQCNTEPCPNLDFVSPIVFNPKPIAIDNNSYEFDHLKEFDLVLLRMPDRTIQTNMLTIDLDAPELAELHQGMMIDVIRDVVYEKKPLKMKG